MNRKFAARLLVFLLFFGCVKFYLLSPFYMLADVFYGMPASAFDNCDGECKKGMVFFPITRIKHALECG